MKARITYEHEATARAQPGTFEEKTEVRNGVPCVIRVRPVGMIIEQTDAWKLVANGIAEPADDECAARFTPEQVAYASENGHPRLMRLHKEKSQEAKDNAELSAIAEPDDSED